MLHSCGAVGTVRSKAPFVVLITISIVSALLAVGAWALSRDDAQATHESGGGLGLPRLAPIPSEPSTVMPSPSANKTTSKPIVPAGKPLRLLIPAINVKASVDSLGTLPDGSQQVPENFTDVSWWKDGQLPGAPGNAVFAGHTYSKGDGVFDRLPKLKKGDVITVVTAKGKQHFRVSSVGSVPLSKYHKVAPKITRATGKSGIVLQTCGDWNGSSYDATTVVYAERSNS